MPVIARIKGGPGVRPLTKTQERVLRFCLRFFRENDQLPTQEDVRAELGLAHRSGGQFHLDALRRKGYLERNVAGKLRFSRRPGMETIFPHLEAWKQL